MRNIFVLALMLPLCGCLTAQERQDRVQQAWNEQHAKFDAMDDQECRSYGAAQGSPAYIDCRSKLMAARYSAPATGPTTCVRNGNITTCN
jgi:hypothetical protein